MVTGLIAALPSQAKDTSENGLDGKLEGKVKVVDGKFGEALQFDGNSYVEIPFNELLNIKHMTLICWVNAEKAAAVQQFIDGNHPPTPSRFIRPKPLLLL